MVALYCAIFSKTELNFSDFPSHVLLGRVGHRTFCMNLEVRSEAELCIFLPSKDQNGEQGRQEHLLVTSARSHFGCEVVIRPAAAQVL